MDYGFLRIGAQTMSYQLGLMESLRSWSSKDLRINRSTQIGDDGYTEKNC
jgi:hypothetical protein